MAFTASPVLGYGDLFELTRVGRSGGQSEITFTYDENGNRKTRKENGTLTHQYFWDIENRLETVRTFVAGVQDYDYGYDNGSRRVYIDNDGEQERQVVYAGDVSVEEYVKNPGDPEFGVSPEVQYIRGLDAGGGGGVGGLLYVEDGASGEAQYAVSNHRGDVIGRFDESGGQVTAAVFAGDGQVLQSEGDGFALDRFGQNTKEFDAATGLAYFGHRYYDPEVGVWLSRDPLGYADGLNLYQYNHQNAWSKYDPDGQFVVAMAIGFAIGVGIDAGFQAYAYNKEHGSLDGFKLNWGRAIGMGAIGGLTGGVGGALISKVGITVGSGILGAFGGGAGNFVITGTDGVEGNFGEGAIKATAIGAVAGPILAKIGGGVANKVGGFFQRGASGGMRRQIAAATTKFGRKVARFDRRVSQKMMTSAKRLHPSNWNPKRAVGVDRFGDDFVAKGQTVGQIGDRFASGRGLGNATTSPSLLDKRAGVSSHIESFRGGGSYLLPEDAYKLFVKGQNLIGRPDGQFITTRGAMDRLLIEAGGDIAKINQRLGVNWAGKLYRVDIDKPLLHNARLPSGFEDGADVNLFRWGGTTSGGLPEAAIDQIPAGFFRATGL